MLFILNKQEKVVGILKNGGSGNSLPFFDDLLTQDLVTGAETYRFSTVLNDSVSMNLVIGNYIAFMDGSSYKLFQIVQTEETHDGTLNIEIYCESAGLGLLNSVFRGKNIPSCDLRGFLTNILEETSWNVGAVDYGINEVYDLELGTESVYSILQNNIGQYGAEIAFRVEINKGRISNKFIDAFRFRGRVTNERFVFGKNIQGLKRTVDSTELFTALIGKGNGDISFRDITIPEVNKPSGQDFIGDDEAFNNYNNNGNHLMGVYQYETDSPEELLRATYKKLQEVKTPKITYDIDVELLNVNVNIGDTVNIVDMFFPTPILLHARVSKLETSLTNPESNKCTLSNFIEAKTNINKDLLSQLEGFVNGTISDKFPIKNDDISDGAVTGDKIYQNSISTDHLMADSIDAGKIMAGEIKTKHLEAGIITADKIDANIIMAIEGKFESIESDFIVVGEIVAGKADIGTVTAVDGKIDNLAVNVATIKDLEVTNAKIRNLEADNANINNLLAGNITADNIQSGSITAESGIIKDLSADVIRAGTLDADLVNVTNLSAESITTGILDASKINVTNIDASQITSGKIDANIIEGLKVTANDITTGTLDASLVNVIKLNASNISAGILDANKVNVVNLNASNIVAGSIDASILDVVNINASNINTGSIDATKVKITNLNAGSITSGELDASKINVSRLNASNITSGTINGDLINVKNLNAASITSGIIDTSRINISSLSGNLSLYDNTIKITDDNSRVRVQIGEDNSGDYNMYVYNNQGVLMFDATYGVTEAGISNNAVGGDKIKNESITSNKLVIDEIWANSAWINSLQTVDLSAEQITTGKISGERIDITGIISFDSLAPDLKNNFIFDTTGNKTFINGGQIYTNSITAEKINAKGLTVLDDSNNTTFNIDAKGEVFVTGTIQSSNFNEAQQQGYKITKNGDIIMNNAIVRGDVLLPNAGITNFGAVIGNENLIPKTYFAINYAADYKVYKQGEIIWNKVEECLHYRNTTLDITEGQCGIITPKIVGGIKAGTTYTISFKAKSSSNTAQLDFIYIISNEPSVVNKKIVNAMKINNFNTWDKKQVATFTVDKDYPNASLLIGFNDEIITGNNNKKGFQIKELKLEVGDTATPWCASLQDGLNEVRFWSGTDFNNRYTAPFKVYQDGSFVATKGNIGGTFTGELHIGNIHISDTNTTNATFEIKTNNDAETKVKFTDTESFIDSPFILGNHENKIIYFDKSEKSLKFNKSSIEIINKDNSFTNINSNNSIFEIGKITDNIGYKHTLKYINGSVIFSNDGDINGSTSDFVFKRASGRNTIVNVEGEVNVTDIIRLGAMKIARRNQAGNEGVDFIL